MPNHKLPTLERLMIFFSLFAFGLLLYRCIFSESFHYTFLLWNLFLAFVPYLMSKQLIKCKEINLKAIFLIVCWLLFFPACVYLFTDLLKIKASDNFSLWYDVVLYIAFALSGFLPGLTSVKKVEFFLSEHVSTFFVKTTILICFFLSSYSTYIVDFLHLARWNFFADTKRIIHHSERDFLRPENHVHVWIFIFALVLLLDVIYESFKKLPLNKVKVANEISVF